MILMRISSSGIVLIEYFEDCELTAYPDPATGGEPWTIGWGHTGSDVRPGMQISQERADEILLEEDLPSFEVDVENLVHVPMKQCEFDALVSFAFNVGSDIDGDDIAEGLGDSTLLRLFNAGDTSGAADQFLRWNRGNGKVMLGLRRRRTAERSVFLGVDVRTAIEEAKRIT